MASDGGDRERGACSHQVRLCWLVAEARVSCQRGSGRRLDSAGLRRGSGRTAAHAPCDSVLPAYATPRGGCPFLFHRFSASATHGATDPMTPASDARSRNGGGLRSAGVPCGRKAGGDVFHNARHSAVTNMTGAGIPDSVATTITGHRSLADYAFSAMASRCRACPCETKHPPHHPRPLDTRLLLDRDVLGELSSGLRWAGDKDTPRTHHSPGRASGSVPTDSDLPCGRPSLVIRATPEGPCSAGLSWRCVRGVSVRAPGHEPTQHHGGNPPAEPETRGLYAQEGRADARSAGATIPGHRARPRAPRVASGVDRRPRGRGRRVDAAARARRPGGADEASCATRSTPTCSTWGRP
jgi:hypothetical protein